MDLGVIALPHRNILFGLSLRSVWWPGQSWVRVNRFLNSMRATLLLDIRLCIGQHARAPDNIRRVFGRVLAPDVGSRWFVQAAA